MDCGRVSSNKLRNTDGVSSFLTQSHVINMNHFKTLDADDWICWLLVRLPNQNNSGSGLGC